MDNYLFEFNRNAVQAACKRNEYGQRMDERYVRWYQNVIALNEEPETKALALGALIGLSMNYSDRGLFPECIAALQKAEELLLEILEEADVAEPTPIFDMITAYCSHGYDTEARKFAKRSLRIVKQKYRDAKVSVKRRKQLMKMWKEDVSTVIEEFEARRALSLSFIDSLAMQIPESEHSTDWYAATKHGTEQILNDDGQMRANFNATIEGSVDAN